MPPPETFRVLLIEDNPEDAALFCEMIMAQDASPFKVSHVASSLSEGLDIIDDGEIDLAMVDLGLPDSRGIETFEKVHARAPEMPIIVLSGTADEGGGDGNHA